jgi:hypothetical protein
MPDYNDSLMRAEFYLISWLELAKTAEIQILPAEYTPTRNPNSQEDGKKLSEVADQAARKR